MDEIDRLGKYQIKSILGQGAMGVVYEGFDPVIGRTVALKTIRKGVFAAQDLEPLLSRLRHEAQAAGRLTHPGIVTVYDYGEEGETAYIAMEYVRGRELAEVLAQGERLAVAAALDLISQLLDILGYFHRHGVVHRDLKPGNIFVLPDGRIKVSDFGIARIEASDLTQFGDVLGTPSYMSPEQYEGQTVDRRSDLFAAGVILYQLLTGEKPFPGNTMATIMHRVLNTFPPRVSELNGQLPTGLDQVLEKALAKKADDRFQSAEEFSRALNLAVSGENPLLAPTRQQSFSRQRQVEATVALPAEEPKPAPPPHSIPASPAALPVEVAAPRRLWPLLAGLILLAFGAAWYASTIFDHPTESRQAGAPPPEAAPAQVKPMEPAIAATPAVVSAVAAAPAKAASRPAPAHRRPTARTKVTLPPNGSGPRVISQSARSSQPPQPIITPAEPSPEQSPSIQTSPPVAAIAVVTVEQLPSVATPAANQAASTAAKPSATTAPPPRAAIKGPPGLGRKLREDEW